MRGVGDAGQGEHVAVRVAVVREHGHACRLVLLRRGAVVEGDRRRVRAAAAAAAAAAGRRMRSEPVERVDGMPGPLDRRVEGVRAVRVPRLDRRLAPQRVVRGAGVAGAPLGARVDADLPDDVDHHAGLAQRDRVVAGPEEVRRRLVGEREDRRVGGAAGEDEGVTGRDRPAEGDRRGGSRAAVREDLDVVRAVERDRRAGAVVELERLVRARPLDVLGDEELRRDGRCRLGEHDDRRCGRGRSEDQRGEPSPASRVRQGHVSSFV